MFFVLKSVQCDVSSTASNVCTALILWMRCECLYIDGQRKKLQFRYNFVITVWSVGVCTEIHSAKCYCDELTNWDQAVELACCAALYSAK